MEQIKLVICDMDGLMFETGRLAYRAYLASAEYFNYEMTQDVYYYLTGRTEAGIVDAMKEIYGEENDILAWRKKMVQNKTLIAQNEQRVGKKKGLVELIDACYESGVQLALASSTKRETVMWYLELEGLNGRYQTIVAGDEVSKGKPDPEIFLKACEKAGFKPEEAIVLEDSMVGIQAANAAHIRSCLIDDDIYDMPVRHEGIGLKRNIDRKSLPKGYPDYVFESLFDVIKLI